MKIMMLAALAIAAPAIAQTTPAPGDPAMQAPGTIGDTMTPPPADPAQTAPVPPTDAAPADPSAPPAAPMASDTGTPMSDPNMGGYGPPPSPPVPTGVTVRFQQAPTPDQAYPAPAPLAKYPLCKKGQTDKCMQRGGR